MEEKQDNIVTKVFQARGDVKGERENLDFTRIPSYLFLVVGPVAAGKSTIIEDLNKKADLFFFNKDTTRELRPYFDKDHTNISLNQFKKRRKNENYLFHYTTKYKDNSGKVKKVYYGLPWENLEKLRVADGLLSLTDPHSYNIFKERVMEPEKDKVKNIIPILIITSSQEHLKNRLFYRYYPNEKEKERRLNQADYQWEYYESIANQFPHIIINDSPLRLLKKKVISPEDPVVGEVLTVIDKAINKLSSIINFYKKVRLSGIEGITPQKIYQQYIDHVCREFFALPYQELVRGSSEGKVTKFNELSIEDMLADTDLATRARYLFENVYVDSIKEKEGVANIYFNKVVEKHTMKKFLFFFRRNIGKYDGFTTEMGIEFSLTDKPLQEGSHTPLYKIVMNFNGEQSE